VHVAVTHETGGARHACRRQQLSRSIKPAKSKQHILQYIPARCVIFNPLAGTLKSPRLLLAVPNVTAGQCTNFILFDVPLYNYLPIHELTCAQKLWSNPRDPDVFDDLYQPQQNHHAHPIHSFCRCRLNRATLPRYL